MLYSFFFFFKIYLFWLCQVLVAACRIYTCGMHARSSSQTRDQTRTPCIGSMESYPLDHQGSLTRCFILNNPNLETIQISLRWWVVTQWSLYPKHHYQAVRNRSLMCMTRVNPKIILLRGRSQTPNSIHHMIPFILNSRKGKWNG